MCFASQTKGILFNYVVCKRWWKTKGEHSGQLGMEVCGLSVHEMTVSTRDRRLRTDMIIKVSRHGLQEEVCT